MKALILIASLCVAAAQAASQIAQSPDKNLTLKFTLNDAGEPQYELSFKGKAAIRQSKLGLALKDSLSLVDRFAVVKTETASRDETWQPVWGENKTIRSRYNELAVTLEQAAAKKRRIVIRFRLFNDGLAPHLSELACL